MIKIIFFNFFLNIKKMDFTDKIVLVTGGTSGIGLKTVIEFAKHSAAKIYTCGRSLIKWEIAQVIINKKLGKLADKIEFIQTDIRVESEVANLIKTIFDKSGQLDVCVNNAGVNIPPINIWEEEFGSTKKKNDIIKFTFDASVTNKYKQTPLFTNLYGTIFCLKWELKYIFERNDPKKPVNIVNISSTVSNGGNILYPEYTSSKAGIDSITKSVAGQVARYRLQNKNAPLILINAIAPGTTNTELFRNTLPPNITTTEAIELISKEIPLNRLANTNEIANAILMMALYKNTSYITATVLSVDGGISGVPNYSVS